MTTKWTEKWTFSADRASQNSNPPPPFSYVTREERVSSSNSECNIRSIMSKRVFNDTFTQIGCLFIWHYLVPAFLPQISWNFFMASSLSMVGNLLWIFLLRQRHLCSPLETQIYCIVLLVSCIITLTTLLWKPSSQCAQNYSAWSKKCLCSPANLNSVASIS